MATLLTITPTQTEARDMPMGMVYDVTQVLKAYGLTVEDAAPLGELMTGLVRVIDAVPVELGGRLGELSPLQNGEAV